MPMISRSNRWEYSSNAMRDALASLCCFTAETAIAEGEMLDPEGAGEYFEPQARGGLLGRLRSLVHR